MKFQAQRKLAQRAVTPKLRTDGKVTKSLLGIIREEVNNLLDTLRGIVDQTHTLYGKLTSYLRKREVIFNLEKSGAHVQATNKYVQLKKELTQLHTRAVSA